MTLEHFQTLEFKESEIAQIQQSAPEAVKSVLTQIHTEPGVREAISLVNTDNEPALLVLKILADHKLGANILQLLHKSFPNWTTELWDRIDEIREAPETSKLFVLLFPHLPHRIFEFFEPGQFASLLPKSSDIPRSFLREVARTRSPRRLRDLQAASLGWKLYLADHFSEAASLCQATIRLMREFLHQLVRYSDPGFAILFPIFRLLSLDDREAAKAISQAYLRTHRQNHMSNRVHRGIEMTRHGDRDIAHTPLNKTQCWECLEWIEPGQLGKHNQCINCHRGGN